MKKAVHTTLSEGCYKWLVEEAHRREGNLNDVIEGLVTYYKNNECIPEQFMSARFFLKQLIREELMSEGLIKKRFR